MLMFWYLVGGYLVWVAVSVWALSTRDDDEGGLG
jgi:hypothetical protein